MYRVRELPSTYVIENGCDNFTKNFDGNTLMFSTRQEAELMAYQLNGLSSNRPTVGMRFLHSRVIDYDKRPALYEITRIARATVYYRPIYDVGLSSERKGSSECIPVDQFSRIVLQAVDHPCSHPIRPEVSQ